MMHGVLMQAISPPGEIPWFVIYAVVLMTMAIFLLLTLVLVMAYKLNKVLIRLEEISENAGRFVQMGMSFFKGGGSNKR